jgi:hypothetical protein
VEHACAEYAQVEEQRRELDEADAEEEKEAECPT